jgi:hypothetical protein
MMGGLLVYLIGSTLPIFLSNIEMLRVLLDLRESMLGGRSCYESGWD